MMIIRGANQPRALPLAPCSESAGCAEPLPGSRFSFRRAPRAGDRYTGPIDGTKNHEGSRARSNDMHPHDAMHLHDDTEGYRYCPICGGELESRLLKTTEPMRLVCGTCGFVFYLDPKLAVGAIISDADGRIVLVRRAIEPGYGK